MNESNLDYLRVLAEQLRSAIFESLRSGRPHLAVALDTARESIETVLEDREATATRIALARAHAEIALESWREACDLRH